MKNKTTKSAYVYYNRSNAAVTNTYLDIIQNALSLIGYVCKKIDSPKGVPKDSLIICAVGVDAFVCYLKGYRNIVLWQQGANGEESYMRHHSKLRRAVLNFMDCFAMKKAKLILFVSSYMQRYYEKKARTSFRDKAYVMPCFNEVLDTSLLDQKDYTKKVFTYVGSLDLWQCFPETAAVYAQVEKRIPNTFFKVLTFQTQKAEEILRQYGVKNYSVACVSKEQVRSELADATYGFILRHDIDVNRVATPTKISSYLSAGVLPVYSACLDDFHRQAQGKAFAYALDPEGNIEDFLQYVNNGVDKDTVQQEIRDLFHTYYSAQYHQANIVVLAEKRLK